MHKHYTKLGLVGIVSAAVASTTLVGAPAQAAASETSNRGHNTSLATVLKADKGYDHNWQDFDILEKAVGAVLKAKPNSPVKVLAQGKTRVTAFLPTDAAFRIFVRDLTGVRKHTERGTFRALARTANVDTIEAVLLYHVVAGKTLGAKKVGKLDGAKVTTAGGGTITVKIRGKKVVLVDQDPNSRNPQVVKVNINKGNKQIGHAINRVLRPIDL